MNMNTEAILALPAAEKLELIGLLWDNLLDSVSNNKLRSMLVAISRTDRQCVELFRFESFR